MDVDALRKHAGLNDLPPKYEPAEPAKKERGHGRGTTDDRRIQDKALRGIPCIGAGPGAIDGTRPGDSARELEQAARDIRIANDALAKHKAEALRAVRSNLKRHEPGGSR